MNNWKKYCRLIINIIIPLLVIWLIFFIGPQLLMFFLPFAIGWVIAMMANPLVKILEKRVKLVRKHSSMLIVAAVVALVVALLYFIIAKLASEAVNFANDLPVYYDSFSAEVQRTLLRLERHLQFLPQGAQDFAGRFFSHIDEYLNLLAKEIAAPAVTATGNLVKSIPAVMVYTTVTIFSSYLFIIDREKILFFLQTHMPGGGQKYYRYLMRDARRLAGGYFLAQFKIMFVIALILAAGFLVMGVDYALLMAVVISILDFLPILGTGTILIPWAVVSAFSGEFAFAFGLFLIYVLTLVIRQIIQPKIIGDTLGLDPLETLLFLYMGFKTGGVTGMIVAVPVGVLLLNLYRFGAFDSMIYSLKTLLHDMNVFRRKSD